jgi:hypothetical protein
MHSVWGFWPSRALQSATLLAGLFSRAFLLVLVL